MPEPVMADAPEPSFLRAALWATALIAVCSLSLGALYQRAEPDGPRREGQVARAR